MAHDGHQFSDGLRVPSVPVLEETCTLNQRNQALLLQSRVAASPINRAMMSATFLPC
jgi:hypothetical protein